MAMSDECLNIILYYSETIKQYFLEAEQYNNGEDNFSPVHSTLLLPASQWRTCLKLLISGKIL